MAINLKQQVTNLVRFFKAMSTVVEMSIKPYIDPFLNSVKALVAADGTGPNKDLKIGDYTLMDLQRSVSFLPLLFYFLGDRSAWQTQQIYSAVLVMRSYFAVFGDIAKMWTQISPNYIMPGLGLCDDLSRTSYDRDSRRMQEKVKNLESWSTNASDAIAKIASEVCNVPSSENPRRPNSLIAEKQGNS